MNVNFEKIAIGADGEVVCTACENGPCIIAYLGATLDSRTRKISIFQTEHEVDALPTNCPYMESEEPV